MGLDSEFDVKNSGVTDILNACPEFDVMISSHTHLLIESRFINDVLVVQNQNQAKTMSVIDITLTKSDDGWNANAKSITVDDIK